MSAEQKPNVRPNYLKFYQCPSCSGYGFLVTAAGVPVPCSACSASMSLVATFGNKVLYWGRNLSNALLLEERIIRKVRATRIGVLTIIGVLGIIMFLFQFWNIVKTNLDFYRLITDRNFELLFFYVSLVFDFYAWYLFYREKMLKHPIPWRSITPQDLRYDFGNVTYENLLTVPHAQKTDISQFFSEEAHQVLEDSFTFAHAQSSASVDPVHLFASFLPQSKFLLMLGRLGIPSEEIAKRLQSLLLKHTTRSPAGSARLSFKWRQIMFVAYQEAFFSKRDKVELTDVLFALVKADKYSHDIFYDLDVDLSKLHHVTEWTHEQKNLVERVRRFRHRSAFKPKNTMNRAMTARPTRVLDSMSEDLTLRARAGAFFPLIGREEETDALFRALKEVGGSALLVGAPGVGKTAIIQGLSERMTAEDVPQQLKDMRLVSLEVGALIAGAGGIGGVEERMLTALNETVAAGNVIIVVEDIASLFSGAMGAASEAANILANFISQGRAKVVATSTTEDYIKYLENNVSFLRRFQKIVVPEPDFDLTMRILQSQSGVFEHRHKAYYSYDALEKTIQFTTRFIHDRYLPEKAIDVLQQSAILAAELRGPNTIVTKDDVAEIIAKVTKIPVKQVSAVESEKLLSLEEEIHRRMVDQEEAVTAVASALRRARQELRDIKRPIANFLFLGTTGVGKTELAKTVTEVYFGDENKMVRLDMSEYQDQASIYRMIGAPPGGGSAAGHQGGYLTEAVRQQPFTVLLLDELEKAHPDILNIFLQVMDDGRLTDSLGRTIDFTQTIIIATSNAGSQMIQNDVAAGVDVEIIKKNLLEQELQKYFRPEFINRFDAVVVFKPLGHQEVFQIAKLMLKRVSDGLAQKGIQFKATEAAVAELAQKGFDPQFGARPLRRVIQNEVEDALAKFLLKGEIGRRDTVVLEEGSVLRVDKAESFVME